MLEKCTCTDINYLFPLKLCLVKADCYHAIAKDRVTVKETAYFIFLIMHCSITEDRVTVKGTAYSVFLIVQCSITEDQVTLKEHPTSFS